MDTLDTQISSLNTYISRNFGKFNISIYCEKIILCNIPKFCIHINNRNYICDDEIQAWTFIDGMHCALETTI